MAITLSGRAVYNQYWTVNMTDNLIVRKFIEWQNWNACQDAECGSERTLQNQSCYRLSCRNINRRSAAHRLAKDNHSIGRRFPFRHQVVVRRGLILIHTLLARFALARAVALVVISHHAEARSLQIGEPEPI